MKRAGFTRGLRCAALLALLCASPGFAEDSLLRRLVTLRLSMVPEPARPATPQAPARDRCGRNAGWNADDFDARSRTESAIRDASLRYAVAPRLIHSVIRHESNYDPDAVSHKGAMGLMQLMPGTADALGVGCPFDPRENVLAGTRYLRRLYDRLGSWSLALAAYNAGPTRVEAGRIPHQTRRYVRRVLDSWKHAPR